MLRRTGCLRLFCLTLTNMGNIIVMVAVIFFVAAIIVGSITDNTWKNVGITWGLLSIGIVLFGITLTFS